MTAISSETPSELQCQVPTVEPTGNSVLNWIIGAIDQVDRWIGWGADLLDGFGIDSVLSRLREALADFREFLVSLEEAANKMMEAIRGVFMPWIMPSYADRWLQISNDLGNVATVLGPEGLRAPGSPDWTGAAADQYRIRADQSVQAATFGSERAAEYSDALADCATKGQQLYIELLFLVVAIIADLLMAGVEAGTIVGIPAAIITLLASALPLVETAIATVIAIFEFVESQVSTFNQLQSALQAATAVFPNNAWPVLTA